MKLIDTDVAIDHFHGHHAALEFFTTSLAAGETLATLGDAMIAATAGEHDAEIVTRNVKHYPMTDIRIIVPYERGRR